MTKQYSRFLTVVFSVFLAGLLIWHIAMPDRSKSETENRTLAQFPEFSWEALVDGSYTESVEEYFADQFPMRDTWMVLKARAELLLGKREFNGIYLCGDTLISKVETPAEGLVDKNFGYIDRLKEKTEAITGKPRSIPRGDRVVAKVFARTGEEQDVIYNVP